MAEPALEVMDLDVRYGGVAALRGLTLRLDRGEIVGLIGPNGAGKTTTLHAIMGVVRPAGGDIRLAGRSIRGRTPERIARAGVALVPEGRRIYPNLSVDENLRLGLAAGRGTRADLDEVRTALPRARRVPPPPGRRAVRWAAAAARDRASARGATGRAAAGRTVARPRAGSRRPGLRRARPHPRSAGSPRSSSSSARSAPSRSPIATYALSNGEVRATFTPADAEDTDRLVAAYFGS